MPSASFPHASLYLVRAFIDALKSKATEYSSIVLKGLPRDMLHYGRGRPRGQRQSTAELTRLCYLITLAKKYGLDTHRFLLSFLDAWTHKRSLYNGTSIQLREKTENHCVFLVMQDENVLAQLHLSENLLKYLPKVDLASFPFVELTRASNVRTFETSDVQIKDIDAGVKWVNLKARVVEKSAPRNVFSRFGDALALSTATISDGTGSMRLPLWNAQIDRISIGDTVQIQNGRVGMFRGELQVTVGRNGRLQVIED